MLSKKYGNVQQFDQSFHQSVDFVLHARTYSLIPQNMQVGLIEDSKLSNRSLSHSNRWIIRFAHIMSKLQNSQDSSWQWTDKTIKKKKSLNAILTIGQCHILIHRLMSQARISKCAGLKAWPAAPKRWRRGTRLPRGGTSKTSFRPPAPAWSFSSRATWLLFKVRLGCSDSIPCRGVKRRGWGRFENRASVRLCVQRGHASKQTRASVLLPRPPVRSDVEIRLLERAPRGLR